MDRIDEETITHFKDSAQKGIEAGAAFVVVYPPALLELVEYVGRLEEENKMAKALLGDVLDGGYGAHYGWEDAHNWLKANCAEYAAQYE